MLMLRISAKMLSHSPSEASLKISKAMKFQAQATMTPITQSGNTNLPLSRLTEALKDLIQSVVSRLIYQAPVFMTTPLLSVRVPLSPSEADLLQTNPMDSQAQVSTMLMWMSLKIRLLTPSGLAITSETSFLCLPKIKTTLVLVLMTLRVDLPGLLSLSEAVTQACLKITFQGQAPINPTSKPHATTTPTQTLVAALTALAQVRLTKITYQALVNMMNVTIMQEGTQSYHTLYLRESREIPMKTPLAPATTRYQSSSLMCRAIVTLLRTRNSDGFEIYYTSMMIMISKQ